MTDLENKNPEAAEGINQDVDTNVDTDGEDTSTDTGTDGEDVDTGDAKSIEDYKKEINRLNNKLKYKTKSKPKVKDEIEEIDVDSIVDKKLAEKEFFMNNKEINKDEFESFMEKEGLTDYNKALALQNGLKLQDQGFVNQQEAGKMGLHGTFKQKKVEKPNPFAAGPAISRSTT